MCLSFIFQKSFPPGFVTHFSKEIFVKAELMQLNL